MANPLTFREIFYLLTSDAAQKYQLTNWTHDKIGVKRSDYNKGAAYKAGFRDKVPLGGTLVLETLLKIGRNSQGHLFDYYEGKESKLPQPQPPFFANLAELLIALDDQGTPLTRTEDGSPIVFREIECEGLTIAPWMRLWLLYNQEAPPQEYFLSPFMKAHHQNSAAPDWDNPPTALAAQLFASMQKTGHYTADEYASYLYGSNPDHPLHDSATEIIKRIIDGKPLTKEDDHQGILRVLALNLAPTKDDTAFKSTIDLIEASTQSPPPVLDAVDRRLHK
jgi:hypothetical protein